MTEPASQLSLFAYFPESYRDDPAIKGYVRLLASYSLEGLIVPSEAVQLADWAGFLLGTEITGQLE